jgi:hypothetical protein
MGMLPGGDMGGSGGGGEMLAGANVNYLRNFFFEKIGKGTVIGLGLGAGASLAGARFSREATSRKIGVPNYNKGLAEALGTNRNIVSNSVPVQKMPKQVKQKKISKDNTGKNDVHDKMMNNNSSLQDKMRRMMR